ncbi:DUF3017 domain-containing protein [Streptomyces sp. NRRL B-24572]|uniref:DUF3017 domain-containing protein n=1 Tax=Streptomyces sp. NRRL B-24572 TaxID=1962156 RepID=UPI000A3B7191|nr:DUF3017 domain-containing protein [Streptomyces sp. NRRL B-24572]
MTSGTPGAPGNPDEAASRAGGTAPAADGSKAAPAAGGSQAAPAAGGFKRPKPTVVTAGTARPEGGRRAAPGDAPAPARQWPLLTVLVLAGLGLLVVGTDPFPESFQSFRVGAILVGAALLAGAAMRRVVPSVGMLAVRSRFTDVITYGVMGGLIVLLALMVQPDPWLRIPFLEDVLHLTVT